jgi:hypothetical protein
MPLPMAPAPTTPTVVTRMGAGEPPAGGHGKCSVQRGAPEGGTGKNMTLPSCSAWPTAARASARRPQLPDVLSFCQKALRALATLGATTPTQYGADGLCVK